MELASRGAASFAAQLGGVRSMSIAALSREWLMAAGGGWARGTVMKVLGTRRLFEARACRAFKFQPPLEPTLPSLPTCARAAGIPRSPRVGGTRDIVRGPEDQLLATCWSPVAEPQRSEPRFSVALDFRGCLAHRIWQSMLMNEWTLMYAI